MQETMKYLLVEPPKDYTGAKNGVCPIFLDASFFLFGFHRAIRQLHGTVIVVQLQGLLIMEQSNSTPTSGKSKICLY